MKEEQRKLMATKGCGMQQSLSLKKAIVVNPNYAEAHYNLAAAYYHKKQYKLAIEHCDKAREFGYSVQLLLEYLKPYRK